MREAVEVVGHRDLGGDRSDRAGGNRVDGGLLRGVVEPQLVHPFAELHRPTARSEHHADVAARLQIEPTRIELCVAKSLLGRCDGHRNDAGYVPDVLRVDPLQRIEIDLARDAAGERGGIELRDRPAPRASRGDGCKVALPPDAIRTEYSDPRDPDARGTAAHFWA